MLVLIQPFHPFSPSYCPTFPLSVHNVYVVVCVLMCAYKGSSLLARVAGINIFAQFCAGCTEGLVR